MAHTYTVHGHIKRRDGRQEAIWTRTGLSKSAAAKLAKEQRSESGGVAKIVPEEGPAYGPTSKAKRTKTPPAQLDREISEAMSSGRSSHSTVRSRTPREVTYRGHTYNLRSAYDRGYYDALRGVRKQEQDADYATGYASGERAPHTRR